MRVVLLIYGPTAAGKSAFARTLKGEIINADALQIYSQLQLLSARPTKAEMAQLPHHLYGSQTAAAPFSVGIWQKQALNAIDKIKTLPIIVGGTGLYFRSLVEGLSEIPEIDSNLRTKLSATPLKELYHRLQLCDGQLAATLSPNDSQRIIRGLEVFEGTGVPLSEWQQKPGRKPAGLKFIKMILCPPREVLVARAEARLDGMIKAGVLDEVARVKALGLPPHCTALKALGFAAFSAHLEGQLTIDEALAEAKRATRHYIRRQLTWARTQMKSYFVAENETTLHKKISTEFDLFDML